MPITLAELTSTAAVATEPSLVPPGRISPGGVDPLGLRQINFDLMDRVLPGLNNVARHIRPFVVTTWSWRRARQLAKASDEEEVDADNQLRDFVDRIEVIYAWSQFLRNPNADLPGRQVLTPLVEADRWEFGGEAWQKRRSDRRHSTAFTAAITYGPGLKSFGWVRPHWKVSDVLIPTPESTPALDAFERQLAPYLKHPAFSKFGAVSVKAADVQKWAEAWALDQPTKAEKEVMAEMLLGPQAPADRRHGCQLMLAAVDHLGDDRIDTVRSAMAGQPSNFVPNEDLQDVSAAWRAVQVRQLFRLSLEALLSWILNQLVDGAKPSEVLVKEFLAQSNRQEGKNARQWLHQPQVARQNPATLLSEIQAALQADLVLDLPKAIFRGLAFSIAEGPARPEAFERHDRLPLARARKEALAWGEEPTREFLKHVIETWVLAQHLYWAVGRGLADARSPAGKRILRLRVVLEEQGWTLTPGTTLRGRPAPSEDRLRTAITLAQECDCL